jgi:hypothetical protein
MTLTTTFASDKISLEELLKNIEKGKIQLPDFQRGWVWDDDHIISLLASVARAFPIGTVMLLETGNPEISFQTRLIEGVKLSQVTEAEKLILDGQQRLTSLFQTLLSGSEVTTYNNRKHPIKCWYYIDIEKAINPNIDIEEAIISVPAIRKIIIRKKVIHDYSDIQKEYQNQVFPLSKVFDHTTWRQGYFKEFRDKEDKLNQFDQFESEIIQVFKQYQVPIISLKKETPKEAICLVFEKVNTGGVFLSVFDLLTATFSADDYKLREKWKKIEEGFKQYKVLEKLEPSDFLQIITLLATYDRYQQAIKDGKPRDKLPAISCGRKDILNLTLEEYKKWVNFAIQGLEKSSQFLHQQNILTAYYLPYHSQLVPMSAILALLGEKANSAGVKDKIAQWYWCGIFGELYGGASEARINKDLPQVLDWIKSDKEPDTVIDANFSATRLISLRTRTSAAYKGLYALLLYQGGRDFASGTPISSAMYFEEKIDLHHIFPKNWCEKQKIDSKRYNSIINKTLISAKTNKKIGSQQPSIYLKKLEKENDIDSELMDDILKSHFIEPSLRRSDNFEAFFKARQTTLLDRMEKVMGKSISRDSTQSEDQDLDTFDQDE